MPIKKTILSMLLSLLMICAYAQDEKGNSLFVSDSNDFGQQNLEMVNKVEIYPNPSVKYLIVEIKNSELFKVEFEMRSIIGNKIDVMPENIGDGKYRFNVKQFAPGYYFLVVKDDNSRFKQAHKFLKK